MHRTAVIAAFCLLGCAARSGCPTAATCNAALWVDPASGGTADGHMVFAPLMDAVAAGRSADGAEALVVATRPVWMRFDLTALAGAEGVERAVLTLAPHPAWRTSEGAPRLVVHPAAGVMGAEAVATDDTARADVTLPSGVRAPVRVDVTTMVRLWLRGALPAGALTVESTRGQAVFMGGGAVAAAARPRLEVVLR